MSRADNERTLVLGMGNDIASDDAIGLHVVRALKNRLPESLTGSVDVEETSESYFSLLDHLDRYRQLIVVDALEGPEDEVGTVSEMNMNSLRPKRTPTILHGCSPKHILRMAEMMPGVRVADVRVVGITIGMKQDYGDRLSPRVAEAIEPALSRIIAMLEKKEVEITLQGSSTQKY